MWPNSIFILFCSQNFVIPKIFTLFHHFNLMVTIRPTTIITNHTNNFGMFPTDTLIIYLTGHCGQITRSLQFSRGFAEKTASFHLFFRSTKRKATLRQIDPFSNNCYFQPQTMQSSIVFKAIYHMLLSQFQCQSFEEGSSSSTLRRCPIWMAYNSKRVKVFIAQTSSQFWKWTAVHLLTWNLVQ